MPGNTKIKVKEIPASVRKSRRKRSQQEKELFVDIEKEAGYREVDTKDFDQYVAHCPDDHGVLPAGDSSSRGRHGGSGQEQRPLGWLDGEAYGGAYAVVERR